MAAILYNNNCDESNHLKKTTELAENEMEQICILFHEIFPKHSMTVESFRNRYLQTPLGYSIHALLKMNTI